MRKLYLLLYYMVLQYLPMQPTPGYKLFYKLRYMSVKRILKKCGHQIVVKNKCYFGDGSRLVVGDRSQLGQNSRLNGSITIGDDVLMGPDVVMMSTSHMFDRLDIPINQQKEAADKPIQIGNDVWIGTRVIILPGVCIGDQCVIAAGAVVSKSFGDKCIIGGVPAAIISMRGEK